MQKEFTSKRFDVLHSHAQHGELVQLARHRLAHGYQRRHLADVHVHLVPAPLLDLAVVLPAMGQHPCHPVLAILT